MPNIADELSKAAPWAIFGIFMIGFVYAMPYGINGAIRMLLARIAHKTQSNSSTPAVTPSSTPSKEASS